MLIFAKSVVRLLFFSGLPLVYVGFALIYIDVRFDLFSIGLLVLLGFCLRLVASDCAYLRLLVLGCASSRLRLLRRHIGDEFEKVS